MYWRGTKKQLVTNYIRYLTLSLFSCREDISLAVVLTFCSEGDNISDAVNLFLFVNEWLSLVPRKEVTLK